MPNYVREFPIKIAFGGDLDVLREVSMKHFLRFYDFVPDYFERPRSAAEVHTAWARAMLQAQQ